MKTTKWILLAEDDAALAELTMLALRADTLACEIIVARDGAETMDCLHHRNRFETVADGNPVLVLLDLKMPKVDGLEVLQQIKSDPRLKNIPVVMFTSSCEESDVSRSYQLGANAYVVKPVDYQQFNQVLRSVGQFWGVLNELPPEPMPQMDAKARVSSTLAVAA